MVPTGRGMRSLRMRGYGPHGWTHGPHVRWALVSMAKGPCLQQGKGCGPMGETHASHGLEAAAGAADGPRPARAMAGMGAERG